MLNFHKLLEQSYQKAAGVVAVSQDRQRVLTVWPTNQFGGYLFTFPKGRIDQGESPQQTAVREFEEETGIPGAHLKTGSSIGHFEGTTTNTEYFIGELDNDDVVDEAQPPNNPELGFAETEKVEWMWIEDFLDTTTSDRDRHIIMALKKALGL